MLVVQYFLLGKKSFVINFDQFDTIRLVLYILFMRLFPEGDIVSIYTVYCGVFWTFLCVYKICVAQIVWWEDGVGSGGVSVFCEVALDGKDENE